MLVLRTIDEIHAWRGSLTDDIGLVPTMGYLHEGHLSLVRASREENAHLVTSIFVNPAQFAPHEDLARYPRDEGRDLALLEGEGVDAVFVPSTNEMYPDGYCTYVEVEGLTQRLEGRSRPTHFRGVTTIVLKLFNIVQPARAYFGEKDAQQLAVMRRMVADLNLPVEIVGRPIVREADGLAMSSRNVYLTPEQRRAATVLSRALAGAARMLEDGVRDASRIRGHIEGVIRTEPLAEIDYVSVADATSLEELDTVGQSALASVAVRFGATRLIDNRMLVRG